MSGREERREQREAADLAGRCGPFCQVFSLPVLLILIGSAVNMLTEAPAVVVGLIWTAGVAWTGAACLRNALRCGRFHCTVLGIGYPLLALVVLGITVGVVRLQWASFWDYCFFPVTVSAFLPEVFGLKYLPLSVRRFR